MWALILLSSSLRAVGFGCWLMLLCLFGVSHDWPILSGLNPRAAFLVPLHVHGYPGNPYPRQ